MRVLLISHTGIRTGAPMMLLHLAEWLVNEEGIDVATLFRADGALVDEFARHGPVGVLSSRLDRELSRRVPGVSVEALLRVTALSARRRPFDLIYSNTLTNGRLLRALSRLRRPIITHVHELQWASRAYTTQSNLKQVIMHTDRYVAAARCVKRFLEVDLSIRAPIDVVNEFIPVARTQAHAPSTLREQLSVGRDELIVGGSGSIDWRKGDDLFLQVAYRVSREMTARGIATRFVWIGGTSGQVERARSEVEKAGLSGRCHFLPERADPLSAYADFDVFLLTSREDPYPLVMLESAALGKPIVGFSDSGGVSEFAEGGSALTVPYLDVEAMARAVIDLLISSHRRSVLGAAARTYVAQSSDVSIGARKLADLIRRTAGSTRAGRFSWR